MSESIELKVIFKELWCPLELNILMIQIESFNSLHIV